MSKLPTPNDTGAHNRRVDVLTELTESLVRVGYWELDLSCMKIACSDGVYRITGHEPKALDVDFQTAIGFVHADDRDRIAYAIQNTIETGDTYSSHVRLIAKDGSIRRARTKAVRVSGADGRPAQLVGILLDDTDLLSVKTGGHDEVQGSDPDRSGTSERFEKVAEATNDAIWDFDVSQGQLWWGKGFNTLFGYDPEIFQPSFEKLIMLIHPDDRDRVGSRIQEYMSDGVSVNWYEEYKFLKSNGEYAFVIDRAIFIRNEDGYVIRVVGAMTDITYRKIYEDSLLALNKQLEISNSELEQFAYVASHDLQEPLRMVSSFLNLLEKKYGNVFDDKARQYIHFARDGAIRMRQIILDLLDYSRIGKHNEKRKNVDLNDLMKDVLALHRKQIEEKSAQIHVSPLPVLNIYRSPVLQVFQNLVGNALKYVKPGGSVVIHVDGNECEDRWEFTVADNGIGIDPLDHQRIFIIFQRLHARHEYSGTGMGLAIVKKILDDMGGSIRVASVLGEGSKFTFSIPKNRQ